MTVKRRISWRAYEERIVTDVSYGAAGFFYITNHGIPQELIDRAFAINARYDSSEARWSEVALIPGISILIGLWPIELISALVGGCFV